MIAKSTAQTQLWIGNHDFLNSEIITFLQHYFCQQDGCTICITCRQIREKQFHSITWICPDNGYTLETLEVIQEQIAFMLNNDQNHFFILQKADLLTTQCANSLLKTIEEPPQGYHFILCTERKESLLPTIISRCMIRSFTSFDAQAAYQTLYAYFTAQKPQLAAPFLTEINNSEINEHESFELIDKLMGYWIKEYKQTQKTIALKRVELFKKALAKPPMPGSSKIFWKNLFLQYHAISKT
jgi:DNA polymerase-3 subunit delta'